MYEDTIRPTDSRAANLALVGNERAVGWHQDHDDGTKFRYWNGSEWTARANTHNDARGATFVGQVCKGSDEGCWIPGSFRIP